MARKDKKASTDKIEITDAMATAAVAVLRLRDDFDFYDDESLATIASEVYEAMVLAAE